MFGKNIYYCFTSLHKSILVFEKHFYLLIFYLISGFLSDKIVFRSPILNKKHYRKVLSVISK